jgi:hypothetical protein
MNYSFESENYPKKILMTKFNQLIIKKKINEKFSYYQISLKNKHKSHTTKKYANIFFS